MCFTTKSLKTEILTAKKNIICYKLVRLQHSVQRQNSELILLPKFRYNSTYYVLGTVHSISEKNSILDRRRYIHGLYIEGGVFHSKRELSFYLSDKYDASSIDQVIVRCTIPKGARYIANDTEYISNKIRLDFVIITERLEQYCHHTMTILKNKCKFITYKK